MGYGAEWRQHRRAFHRVFNQDVVADWQPVQLKSTRELLRKLLDSPDQLASHLQLCALFLCYSLRANTDTG